MRDGHSVAADELREKHDIQPEQQRTLARGGIAEHIQGIGQRGSAKDAVNRRGGSAMKIHPQSLRAGHACRRAQRVQFRLRFAVRAVGIDDSRAAAGQGGALLAQNHLSTAERVLRLLRSDLSHDWQAEDIAAQLAMSGATLRRKLAGEKLSFRRLLQDARMEQALGLISSSPQALGEIAAACGYQSPSRFAAAFQRQFGCSPSTLRQMSGAGERLREMGAPA